MRLVAARGWGRGEWGEITNRNWFLWGDERFGDWIEVAVAQPHESAK